MALLLLLIANHVRLGCKGGRPSVPKGRIPGRVGVGDWCQRHRAIVASPRNAAGTATGPGKGKSSGLLQGRHVECTKGGGHWASVKECRLRGRQHCREHDRHAQRNNKGPRHEKINGQEGNRTKLQLKGKVC